MALINASTEAHSAQILMGDWCSEEVTDNQNQRNYGNGKVALNP